MPTGVETAGLVLAVLPLLLEALGVWHAGFVKAKTIAGLSAKQRRRLGLKIRGLVDLLQGHQAQLSIDVKRLVLSANPDADLYNLPQDYTDSLWSGPSSTMVDQYLQKLGGDAAVTAFRGVLNNYQVLAEDIAERFEHYLRKPSVTRRDLRALCDLQRNSAGNLTFGQRLRFSFSEPEIDRIYGQLKDFTTSIGSLIDSATELERLMTDVSVSSKTKEVSRITKYLYSIRRQAYALFLALNKAWKPDCLHSGHVTLLHLKADDIGSGFSRGKDFVFHLVFQSPSTPTVKGFWQGSTVVADTTSIPVLTNPIALAGIPRVSFQVTGQQAAETKDICRDVLQAYREQSELSFSLSSDSQKLFSCFSPINQMATVVPSDAKLICLRDFLQSSSRRLAASHVIELAVKLSSSALRFNETPWLRGGLRKENIFFLEDALSPIKINADHVFIAEPFACAAQPAASYPEPYETLLEMAILFMELHHQQTFEQWVAKSHPSVVVALLDDCDWKRVYASKWFRGLPRSAETWDVVKVCIEPSPLHQFDQDWQDHDYRCAYFSSIVWPLLAKAHMESTSTSALTV